MQYQKLDDLSSEFDPFTDADSNYGRVLSISSLSRTNGPVGEDMDAQGSYKGHLQQLFNVDSQFQDHVASGVSQLPEAGTIGTNRAFLASKVNKGGRWYEGVEKSRVQMLAAASSSSPIFKDQAPKSIQKLPDAGIVGTDMSFLQSKSNKAGQWYEGMEKSRVQMLARPVRFQAGGRHYQNLPEAGAMGTNKAFIGRRPYLSRTRLAPSCSPLASTRLYLLVSCPPPNFSHNRIPALIRRRSPPPPPGVVFPPRSPDSCPLQARPTAAASPPRPRPSSSTTSTARRCARFAEQGTGSNCCYPRDAAARRHRRPRGPLDDDAARAR